MYRLLLHCVLIITFIGCANGDQRCPGVPAGGICPHDSNRLNDTVCCGLGISPYCCTPLESIQLNRNKIYILWGCVGVGLLIGLICVPILIILFHFSVKCFRNYFRKYTSDDDTSKIDKKTDLTDDQSSFAKGIKDDDLSPQKKFYNKLILTADADFEKNVIKFYELPKDETTKTGMQRFLRPTEI